MITLKEFKDKLMEDSIVIEDEKMFDGINILTINSLPSSLNKIRSDRREIYEYGKFIIKSADKQKFSSENKTDIDELKLEILAVKKFGNKIPILEKLAIIQQDSGKVFLIEELLVPYDKFKDDIQLKEKASQLLVDARKIFKDGDFKMENIVYDNITSKLLFTDVFPSETHLITTDGVK